VLILGGARQGQAAASFLARHGAHVTVNDRRSAEEMISAREALSNYPITWVLGSHPIRLLKQTDLVCVSGGIPSTNPILIEALKIGMPVTNDTQIFMQAVPCRTIGITGSAGKTTTTTIVGRVAKSAYEGSESAGSQDEIPTPSAVRTRRSVYIGGNIGDPLLNHLDDMNPEDLAILEISSFQLEQMTVSPNIAAILNITPNHLDRHRTMEAYTAAKRRILEFQKTTDVAILGRDDPGAWQTRTQVIGNLLSFGLSPMPAGQEGTFMRDGFIFLRTSEGETPLLHEKAIGLLGVHNKLNVMAACTITCAAGLPAEAILAGVEGFGGVTHRLEFIRTWGGAAWYNDSIATTPERTIAAIQSFCEPIVLLLGGRDKDLPWKDLAELVHQRVDHVILFGEAAEKIRSMLGNQAESGRPYSVHVVTGLRDAIRTAAGVVQAGDVVLLSPGCTSFDEFRDFEERGECFRKWILELT